MVNCQILTWRSVLVNTHCFFMHVCTSMCSFESGLNLVKTAINKFNGLRPGNTPMLSLPVIPPLTQPFTPLASGVELLRRKVRVPNNSGLVVAHLTDHPDVGTDTSPSPERKIHKLHGNVFFHQVCSICLLNLADLTKYLFLFFVLYIVWFVQVSFVYPSRPNDPILSRVDFALKAGTVTALVGSSGAGKSTIASLLLRYVLIALCSRIIPKSYSSWWASCACC